MPSEYGFPYIIRLPLGITRSPVTGVPLLHSSPLPQWVATDAQPLGGFSDPTYIGRETKRIVDAIARAAALFGPF